MTTMTMPRAVPRLVTTFDRFLLASSAALLTMVERRHDNARLLRVDNATEARRDAAAVRHLGMLPR